MPCRHRRTPNVSAGRPIRAAQRPSGTRARLTCSLWMALGQALPPLPRSHRRLAEMEAILAQSLVATPFSQYVNDVSPTESRVVGDYFHRLRDTMLACLEEAGIPLEVRRTSLRWALQCGITFLHIAVAEMS